MSDCGTAGLLPGREFEMRKAFEIGRLLPVDGCRHGMRGQPTFLL
jgi:hypothetical protein